MMLGVRKWPLVPTIIVAVAAAIMVKLGFWQLDRLIQKEAMLAAYAKAVDNDAPVAFPLGNSEQIESRLYRRSSVNCAFPIGDWRSVAGRSADGQPGYVHIIECGTSHATSEDEQTAFVQAGWTQGLTPPEWTGGEVSGRIAPYSDGGARLIADPPVAGLGANARPDPSDLPNNHLAYAGQWFFFALTALVIYVLALRRRQRDEAAG